VAARVVRRYDGTLSRRCERTRDVSRVIRKEFASAHKEAVPHPSPLLSCLQLHLHASSDALPLHCVKRTGTRSRNRGVVGGWERLWGSSSFERTVTEREQSVSQVMEKKDKKGFNTHSKTVPHSLLARKRKHVT
jgi:hypothetical protein